MFASAQPSIFFIRSGVSVQHKNKFLKAVEKRFKSSDRYEAEKLLTKYSLSNCLSPVRLLR